MVTGAYILMIKVSSQTETAIGFAGTLAFSPGWYVYVGSAMGQTSTSLFHRLRRHFSPKTQKKVHWHIDYLLALEEVALEGAIVGSSPNRMECKIVEVLCDRGFVPWGHRFGATDCHQCPSHLFFIRESLRDDEELMALLMPLLRDNFTDTLWISYSTIDDLNRIAI